MDRASFEQICISGNDVSNAINHAITYIGVESDFERDAEYIARISQQILISHEDKYWQELLRLCKIAELEIKSSKGKSYIYKTYLNYYNSIGLSPKVVEYALKYEKLGLPKEDNYEVFSMVSFSFFETGFYDKAIEYILKSQTSFSGIDVDVIFKAISYNNLVYCYDAIGRIDKALESYNKLKQMIVCEINQTKKEQMEILFKMSGFFIQLKTNGDNDVVLETVLDKYVSYINELADVENSGVMESEDVHLPFVDYMVKKGKLELAALICRELIDNRNICGSKKNLYYRLISVYQLMGDNVSGQTYFDTLFEYNKVLEKYNENFDRIMHELVNEQFRISKIEEQYREMKQSYGIDSLTDCLNRKMFDADVREEQKNQGKGTVIFMDLDYLKSINDRYGHDSGDVYIRYFSYLISNVMSPDSKLYRYGGDEFVIISKSDEEKAKQFINKLKETVKEPCRLIDDSVHLEFSYGIAVYGENVMIMDAIKNADEKMYADKGSKRR